MTEETKQDALRRLQSPFFEGMLVMHEGSIWLNGHEYLRSTPELCLIIALSFDGIWAEIRYTRRYGSSSPGEGYVKLTSLRRLGGR